MVLIGLIINKKLGANMTSPTTTSSTNSSGGIRLGGLTSGFDTDAIIKQLLARDQTRIDRLKEEQELNKAKINTWTDVAEQLQSLAASVTSLRADGTTGNTLYDDKVVSTTNDAVVSATASSSAVNANYTIAITQRAQANVAYGSQKATTYTLPAGGNIVIGGTTIALTTGMTLQQIANEITGATYTAGKETIGSVIDNRLVLQTANTGASYTLHGTTPGGPPFVNVTDDPSNILQTQLGIINGAGNLVNESQAEQDASFTVNGITVTSESNTIDDVITGVTFELEANSGTATISVQSDTSQVKEKITEFVDLYNETRDFLERARTAKVKDTDQFGLFHSDSLMRSLFNELRTLTTTGVKMGDSDWNGSVTVAAAALNATTITMNAFTAVTGTLAEGDQFTIVGDTTIYTVTSDATIAANSASVSFKPPLAVATAGGQRVNVAVRTMEEFGVATRTDIYSGTEGVIGITDEGLLDNMLASNLEVIKAVFSRIGNAENTKGIGRRLYDWIDDKTKISAFTSTTREIDDSKLDGLDDANERLDEQIARLEERMARRESALIRQFANMENAMNKAQSAGGSLAGLGGGSSGG
jgi:flagellar hook-associated protein 2